MDLKAALKGKLSEKQLAILNKSFDSVGQVAIIEIPEELQKKKKLIAETLLKQNKQFKTIAEKVSGAGGKYRIKKLKVIIGSKSLTAEYRESGCSFKVSLGKVYFSPRFGTERLRLAKLVQPKENVGVFFAGCGPYCIVIMKHSKATSCVGFEWNPVAVKDFEENIRKNKMQTQVQAVKGDVKKTAEKFKGKFDRIIMPSPSNAIEYFKTALQCCKKNAVIHYYCFSETSGPFKKRLEEVKKIARENGKSLKLLDSKVVRPYSKEICQIVLDLRVK
ncbi:MAG: methyltransferase [Candidatus Diapherotrites archaeon]|nr:methyltransferase [Candidatus Diapherotrites archaeon]